MDDFISGEESDHQENEAPIKKRMRMMMMMMMME
jgi:hypothetical protein